jgi:hypothetical protein
VRAIRFCLRREHAGGSRRRFSSQAVALDEQHVANSTQGKRARDGQTDNAATDNRDLCSFACLKHSLLVRGQLSVVSCNRYAVRKFLLPILDGKQG